jgi:hypothetical protein
MRVLICCFVYMMFFTHDCISQSTDSSFSFLWYKGKKLNDSTLLTPTGRRIAYQPLRGRVDAGMKDKNDVYNRIKSALQQSEQRKTAIAQRIIRSPHGTLKLGFIYHVNRAMDEVHKAAEKLAGTELELTVEEGRRMPLGEGDDVPLYVQQFYDQVMQFISKVSTNPGTSQPPVPPDAGLDYCYPCDDKRQKAFKEQAEAFTKYLEEERTCMQKAMSVMHYFSFRKVKNLAYDSLSESKMVPHMMQAIRFLLTRIGGKLMKMWTQYKQDAGKLQFLVQEMVDFSRTQQLMGLNAYEGFPTEAEVAQQCVNAGIKQLDKAKRERDYRILLNVRWIVGLYRTADLMNLDQSTFENTIVDFLRINQFEMSVQASATMGNGGTEMSAVMSGKNLFGAAPDSNCVLKWKLLEPDSSKMRYTLEDAKMQIPKANATYTGTTNWKSNPANLQLDFCKEEKDTALLYGFRPHQGVDSWTVQGRTMSPAQIINSIYMTCFMDVKRIRAAAADAGLEARLMQQMQDKYKEFMAAYQGSGKDFSQMSSKELEQMAEAMNASSDMSDIVQSPTPYSFLCKQRLRNNQKLVFDVTLNGKELIQENTNIKQAIFTVKIEHVVD